MLELRFIIWRGVAPFDAVAEFNMVLDSWEEQDRWGHYLEYAAPFPVVVETYFN